MTTVESFRTQVVAEEVRHIARVLTFDAHAAPYINWNSVAQTARELGAHIDARYAREGACTITLWWTFIEGE